MRRFPAPRILLPLRHRDFRLLIVGQTVSSFGNFFFYIALPLQLLALGATAVELGIAVTILGVSSLVFILFGGAVADRLPRRRLILASDAVCAVVTAAIAVLAWTDQLRVEHVYVASAILGAASAFLIPASNAIITELVPADLLTEANAARTLGGAVARTAGPLVAGLVIAFWGTPLAFAVDALSFVFSFLLFLVSHAAPRRETPNAQVLRQVRDGIAFVAGTPWLWMALVALAFLNITYGGQRGVMTPLFVKDSLHQDAATLGILVAAFGAGQIAGSLFIAQLRVTRPGVAMYVFEALGGLSTALIGLVVWLPATLVGMALMGLALSSSDALFNAAVQRHVPAEMLGRVTSITFLVAGILIPVSPIIAGVLVELVGPAQTFVIAGLFALILAVLLLRFSPVRSLQ